MLVTFPSRIRFMNRSVHLSTVLQMALKANLLFRLLNELTFSGERFLKTKRSRIGPHDLVTG